MFLPVPPVCAGSRSRRQCFHLTCAHKETGYNFLCFLPDPGAILPGPGFPQGLALREASPDSPQMLLYSPKSACCTPLSALPACMRFYHQSVNKRLHILCPQPALPASRKRIVTAVLQTFQTSFPFVHKRSCLRLSHGADQDTALKTVLLRLPVHTRRNRPRSA